MKNNLSPEIRFRGFTDEWKNQKLGEVFEQTSEYVNPKVENLELWSLTVEKGLTPKTARYNREFLVKKEDQFKAVSENEFIYNPMNVTLGAVDLNLTGKKVAVSGYYITMKSIINYNKEYFNIWLKSPLAIKKYKSYATGSLIERQRVQFPTLAQIKASIPSLEEQTKIGEFFKQLDDLIALQQQELTILKQTKQGFLQKMFPKEGEAVPEVRFPGFTESWKYSRIGEITESYSGGTPSAKNKLYYGGIIPFIRSGEINASNTELFLTESGFNNSSAKIVEKGDILYALYGATSGEVGISQINGAINQAILAIKPRSDNNSNFIMQWLKRQKRSIISTYLQGGQGNLSGSIVKDLIIPIPQNIEEQVVIGTFFKQLDKVITLHEQELEALQQTKKAFLQKMFV
ncbi:type I restriction endonuclease [Sporosarcina sp. P21c]|nr:MULTISPECIES: restriction endonuclease subunit S [unclassified Sporosarcina]PIC67357.1 type I restriction endonuclease [Sporosarcina sp. P16a]PIC90308.1 type I restriction endonuclease [Sporosarcina sp. P21c]PIC92808.1 type I restriction endonuclease [Sporosarcina sp. P25]